MGDALGDVCGRCFLATLLGDAFGRRFWATLWMTLSATLVFDQTKNITISDPKLRINGNTRVPPISIILGKRIKISQYQYPDIRLFVYPNIRIEYPSIRIPAYPNIRIFQPKFRYHVDSHILIRVLYVGRGWKGEGGVWIGG